MSNQVFYATFNVDQFYLELRVIRIFELLCNDIAEPDGVKVLVNIKSFFRFGGMYT